MVQKRSAGLVSSERRAQERAEYAAGYRSESNSNFQLRPLEFMITTVNDPATRENREGFLSGVPEVVAEDNGCGNVFHQLAAVAAFALKNQISFFLAYS
jgi:hypothetical protein